jgi:hypothetical protein
MAAIGHGRSFGQDSSVLGRKISGIFPCALWQDLRERSALSTTALVTDVGNDLLYGNSPARIVEWVAACVAELQQANARVVITQLPLASLERLGERRFQFFRRLLFPSSRLTLSAALALSAETNERLAELGKNQNTSVIPVSGAWYGFDPIHVRRGARREAWSEILSHLEPGGRGKSARRLSVLERAYLMTLPRKQQSWFGVQRRAQQPGGRLRDGTTLSLY